MASISNNPLAGVGAITTSEGIPAPTKRYLKDFPEESKTYDPHYKATRVKTKDGYELIVPDDIQDKLVLENSEDDKLHRLARLLSLVLSTDSEYMKLQDKMVADFGEEKTKKAINAIAEERFSFYSPIARELANLYITVRKVLRARENFLNETTHIGPDGQRYPNIRPRITTRQLLESVRDDILQLPNYLRQNHPTACRRALKTTVVVSIVFFWTLLFYHVCLQKNK